jgi:hypothetical protein
MNFRRRTGVRNLVLRPDGVNDLAFTVERYGRDLKVRLWSEIDPDTQWPADESTQCEITVECEPPGDVRAAFEALADLRLPKGYLPRDDWSREHPEVDRSGRIGDPGRTPMYLMPKGLQDFVGDLATDLTNAGKEVLGVLRWRSAEFGPPRITSATSLLWSLDGQEWHGTPRNTTAQIVVGTHVELTDDGARDIKQLLANGQVEPLGHELLREAWAGRRNNPGSSLLIGVAALETGIKTYVSKCVPDAAWLVEEGPSPPVAKMMQKYLPDLEPVDGGRHVKRFPKPLMTLIDEAIEARNSLAHAGDPRGKFDPSRLQDMLLAIRDVLWTLDAALGHEWAEDYVREDVNAVPGSGYRPV